MENYTCRNELVLFPFELKKIYFCLKKRGFERQNNWKSIVPKIFKSLKKEGNWKGERIKANLFEFLKIISELTGWFTIDYETIQRESKIKIVEGLPKAIEISKEEFETFQKRAGWPLFQTRLWKIRFVNEFYMGHFDYEEYAFIKNCYSDFSLVGHKYYKLEKRMTKHIISYPNLYNVTLHIVTSTISNLLLTTNYPTINDPTFQKQILCRKNYLYFMENRISFYSLHWKIPKYIVMYIFYLYDLDIYEKQGKEISEIQIRSLPVKTRILFPYRYTLDYLYTEKERIRKDIRNFKHIFKI